MPQRITLESLVRESRRNFTSDRVQLAEDHGIVFMDGTRAYLPEPMRKRGGRLSEMDITALDRALFAMDAGPQLTGQPILTTTPNNAIPALLTTFIDPDILMILFAANKAARILGAEGSGERKKGDWTEMVAMFPVLEHTGQVTSYGDYENGGSAGINFTFPQRQSYHYQNVIRYGEREIAMAAKAQIDIASQKKRASTLVLDKFQNTSYFYGISGLQNYGLLNDPLDVLDEADGTLRKWADVAESAFHRGEDIAAALSAEFASDLDGVAEEHREKLEVMNGVHSNAAGLHRWLSTRHPGTPPSSREPDDAAGKDT